MRNTSLLPVALLLVGCAGTEEDTQASGVPVPGDGGAMELVYEQDFGSVECLQEFTFSDAASWTWSRAESALVLGGVGEYRPEHRSPVSLAILEGLELEDFVLEADLQQTGRNYGHQDMCIFFGYVDPEHFYYVHLAPAPDENAHNVFLVDDAPRRNLAPPYRRGMEWQGDKWYRIRLERSGERVRVFVDGSDQPILEARDHTLSKGRVGFGSFDDSGMIRNVRIWAPAER